MTRSQGYLFLELAVTCMLLSFRNGTNRWKWLHDKEFMQRCVALFGLWTVIDVTAVALGIWSFPTGGTLPWRLWGLPVEEYVLFLIHTLLCQTVLEVLEA